MGTLCMPRFILPLIFRPSHERGQQAMLLRVFDRMPKREGEVEQVYKDEEV